jgi:hypothetical protein
MPFAPKQASQVAEPTKPKGSTGALAPRQQRNGLVAPWKPGQSGNPKGRAVGSRHKLSAQYLDDSYRVWQEEGIDALRKCARNSPARYIAVMAQLIPQHFKVEHDHTIAMLSVEELREKLVEARRRLIASGVDLPVIEAEVVEPVQKK